MPIPTEQTNNPVPSKQEWTTEPGFIDSYYNDENVLANTAGRGLLGAGLGAAGGTALGRNPWITGATTGMGSTLGYLLAHTLSKGNPDAGLRSTYENLASILGGSAGFGGGLLLKNRAKKEVTLPGELQLTAKTAGFTDVLRSINAQLPSIRGAETVVGGGLGALGGLGYDALRDNSEQTPKQRRMTKLKRVLVGAGAGALGTNVVTDRLRRYLANNWMPYGYGEFNMDSIKPKSVGHVWDSAILDKPQQAAVKSYQAGKFETPHTPDPTVPFNNTKANAAARWELGRRFLGVHTENPTKDIFATQPDKTISLNPGHKNVENLAQEFYFPKPGTPQAFQFLNAPLNTIAGINKYNPDVDPGLLQSLAGGQRISVTPYPAPGARLDYLAKMQDQWGFRLRTKEQRAALESLKNKLLFHKPTRDIQDSNAYADGTNQGQYLQRWVLDKLIGKKAPWLSGRMYYQRTPANGYLGIPTTASGELFPGNTIGQLQDNELAFTDSSVFK